MAKERKYLTDEQKMEILKDYDASGCAANMVCEKWKIQKSSFYEIKKQLWDIYLATFKAGQTERAKINSITTVAVKKEHVKVIIASKAASVLEKTLSIIEHRLTNEENRLIDIDNGKKNSSEPITFRELTEFFKVAAPYHLDQLSDAGGKSGGGGLVNRGTIIANILNQKHNGNNLVKN